MTLAEIEVLVVQMQENIAANTAAIKTLNTTLSNYATDDDLAALTETVKALNANNTTLQNSVTTLTQSVKKIDNLQSLLDVNITNLTGNDLLHYDIASGKWKNIQPSALGISSGGSSGGATKLVDLYDVSISAVSDGQALVYSASLDKWINSTVSSGGSVSGDYLTKSEANQLYLSLRGGIIDGSLTINNTLLVKGLITGEDNVLVSGGVTMYNE